MTTKSETIIGEVNLLPIKHPNQLQNVLKFIRTKPLGGTGLIILFFCALIAAAAPLIATQDPWSISGMDQYLTPSSEHYFGTDVFGRDLYSRVVYGTRVSLYIGLIAMVAATSLGATLGVTSAYYGGKYDLILQRFVDVLTMLPSLVLALALMSVFGPGMASLIVAMVIIFTSRSVRVIRAQTLSIKEMPYVEASIAIGGSDTRIILRHILPNTFGPTMVIATTMIGSAIIIEASLSFLGVGLPVGTISWGGMLSGEVLREFSSYPWIGIFPGMALTIVVFAINVLGDALRDVFDPRMRGR
jgi:peptide/nickel transport system permease protein